MGKTFLLLVCIRMYPYVSRMYPYVGHMPGGGGGGEETPIWNRRGRSSEILNLTPKEDHLGVVQAFCDP